MNVFVFKLSVIEHFEDFLNLRPRARKVAFYGPKTVRKIKLYEYYIEIVVFHTIAKLLILARM